MAIFLLDFKVCYRVSLRFLFKELAYQSTVWMVFNIMFILRYRVGLLLLAWKARDFNIWLLPVSLVFIHGVLLLGGPLGELLLWLRGV